MSDDKYRAYQPTGSETLEKLVMDPNIPKSETEGWACREIERLRARVEVLEAVLHAIFPDGANIKLVPKASAEEAKP
jgi:hypothetical protein